MKNFKKAIVNIGGMHCAMCVKRVEQALKKLKFLKKIYVNLSDNNAKVLYNEKRLSEMDIKKAIEEAGYEYLGLIIE